MTDLRCVVCLVIASAALAACGSTPPRADGPAAAGPASADAPIVALVENAPVHAAELDPVLFELAGREALREVVLDRALEAELARRGLTLTEADLDRERALLQDRLAAGADRGRAGATADEVYRSRGLGPARRASLVRRNAILRRLVADQVHVSDDDVRAALEIAYGPKRTARVIVVANERDAAAIRDGLGPAPSASDFARAAAQSSIDPSSARGGLLEPIHLADATVPAPVREALGRLEPGQVSPIIALPQGSAIVRLESIEPATTPPPDAAGRLRAELAIQKQRAAMDALARRLVTGARVDVLDRSLGWSWEG